MVLAVQRMVEVHAELMQAMTQNLINSDSKELPPGMQQLLDDHSRMVQMMPQILASTNLPQDHQCNRRMEKEIKTTMPACEICGEVGHPSGECPEQCYRCPTSHSTRECPRAKVTCLLCYGIDRVPKECKFYFTVQQMNQQAREKLRHLLEGAPEVQVPKVKMEAKDQEEIPDTITQSGLINRRQERLLGKDTRK
jgi:hypothetical protein